MDLEHQIEEGFIRFGKKFSRASILIEGAINSVDETNFTCEVNISTNNPDNSSTDVIYSNVPLKILVGSQASILEIPTIGSDCLLGFKDNNIQRPQLYSTNLISKYIWLIGTQKLQVTTDGFIFNDGQLGGMVKVKELQDQSNKDKSILDGLLNIINGSPIAEPGNGAPSAFQIALKGVLAFKTTGTWDALENEKIKM